MEKIIVHIELKNAIYSDYVSIDKYMSNNNFYKETAIDNAITYSIDDDICDRHTAYIIARKAIQNTTRTLKKYSIEVTKNGEDLIKLENVH